MTDVKNLITDNIDVWTSAIKKRNATGRGSSKKVELTGIKKLRELILELAVSGKLVPQDHNDEPASVLLEKIAKEKAQLLVDKKLKKQKPLPAITEEEKPFELSSGWAWCKFGEIAHLITDGAHHTPKYIDVGVPFLSVKDMSSGRLSFTDTRFISKEQHDELSKRCPPTKGDLLLTKIGTTGVPIIIDTDIEFSIFVSVALIKFPIDKISGKYLSLLIKSPLVKKQSNEGTEGVGNKNLVLRKIAIFNLAIPPLAEQHRIVAKVDELMALCDQLEQQTEQSITAHQTLVEVLLNALFLSPTQINTETDVQEQTQGSVEEQFQENWQRIADHFDVLFTTEASIDQLKQTILQLAVMGKLVPQNPSDEPASKLLEKIAEEKAQLIKDKKIKKQKPLPEITDEEKPFAIPNGWEWCRLQDSIDVRDGTHDSPKDAISGETFPLVTSKDFNSGDINFESTRKISAKDHFEISKRSLVEVDDILFSMIGGNIGNQVIVKDERPFSIKNVALFKYYDKTATEPYYFKIYTENLASVLQDSAVGGAQPFISLGALRKLVFALPPLKEQHRIVAKVDELMALCDQLKTRLADAQTTQLHLADAVVSHALDASK